LPSIFQTLVWAEIDKIPKGKTLTYKQIAIKIGKPSAARAVANACAQNPQPISTPCHRVIRSDGAIGGYSGAGAQKQKGNFLQKKEFFSKL
jgi:methylated-DNA-[protein]-cysteine S-methyltransferase